MKLLIQLLKQYQPFNDQERFDQAAMITFLSRNPDALERSNTIAHITTSTLVVNPSMDRIVFGFHNIYQSWAWVGGHNDGDPDLLKVALSEAKEETGVKNITPYSNDIFTIDVILVKNHLKHQHYVPDHLHLNVAYLLIADENDELIVKKDENSGVKWFPIEEVLTHVSEDRMKVVYQKAFNEISRIRKSL
jgi:ADP-ribose pyrophosphatase YjhB (NUDIX family)